MAYIYVKSGGTAHDSTGRYTSAKTGSWSTAFTNPSEYFNDFDACSGYVTAGDTVYVSDLHNATKNLIYDLTLIPELDAEIICVSDSNLSLMSVGATETHSVTFPQATYSISIRNKYIYGVKFITTGNFSFSGIYTSGPVIAGTYENCHFILVGNNSITTNRKYTSYNVTAAYFINCTIEFDSSTNWVYPGYFLFYGPCNLIFIRCTWKAYLNSLPIFYETVSSGAHASIQMIACDFSQANRPIFPNNQYFLDPAIFRICNFDRCSFNPSSKLQFPTKTNQNIPLGLYSSYEETNSTYLNELYLYGKVESQNTVYRVGGAYLKFDMDPVTKLFFNSDPFALKVTSFSTDYITRKCLRFKLADFYADTTSSRTFSISIAQSNTASRVSMTDIVVELFHADDTTAKAHYVCSESVIANSSTLWETDGAEWIGITDPYKQKLSITSTATGKNGLCSIWISIYSPNKEIYFCPKVLIS